MKKAILYFIVTVSFLNLTSCTIDSEGNIHLTWIGWMLIASFGAFLLFLIASIVKGLIEYHSKAKNAKIRLKEAGLSADQIFYMGRYIGGHPDINESIIPCQIHKKDEDFIICHEINNFPEPITKIPIASIKNILVEDRLSIEKKVTLGRILLVGIFALAWTKDKKIDDTYLTIEWYDGRFSHTTVFEYVGNLSMEYANKTRNSLIKLAR